jgi:predicted ester cyclase
MSVEQNKAVVQRYYEEIGNQRNFDVADEIFAPEFKMFPWAQPPYGGEGVKGFMRWFIDSNFPDLRVVIDDIVGEGDVVVVRVTVSATQTKPLEWIAGFGSIPASGKPFSFEEYVFWRVIDGKIVERRVCADTLGLLYQIGAVKTGAE